MATSAKSGSLSKSLTASSDTCATPSDSDTLWVLWTRLLPSVRWLPSQACLRGVAQLSHYLYAPSHADIATVVGFYVVSRPFLGYVSQEGLHVNDRAALIEDYYSSGRMLLRMAQAVSVARSNNLCLALLTPFPELVFCPPRLAALCLRAER